MSKKWEKKRGGGKKNSFKRPLVTSTCDGKGGCTLFRAACTRLVELDLLLCCITHGQLWHMPKSAPGSVRVPPTTAQVARGPVHGSPMPALGRETSSWGWCCHSWFCCRKTCVSDRPQRYFILTRGKCGGLGLSRGFDLLSLLLAVCHLRAGWHGCRRGEQPSLMQAATALAAPTSEQLAAEGFQKLHVIFRMLNLRR